jgi:hypothetical protein
MATQVKPRLIQPKRFTGHQKSADVIRNQPAYSIRARDHASQTEAECMAAIYTCKAGTKKMLGKKGRPCMKRDTGHQIIDRIHQVLERPAEPVEPILGKSARNLPQAEWALQWVNGDGGTVAESYVNLIASSNRNGIAGCSSRNLNRIHLDGSR